MKAVLISIQPKWVDKITSGEKTVEVRKTRPKLDAPFKCYIYCTYGNPKDNYCLSKRGKVIGEFVCDRIDKYILTLCDGDNYHRIEDYYSPLREACLTQDKIVDYGQGKDLYGWHISNLKVYDKPKELSEFNNLKRQPIQRAFQSWGYCYEKEN